MDIRNIAIIAHVDHGKTTLVDGLLKQTHTFRENQAEMSQTTILDRNDLEREKGITILAKNTAVTFNNTKINIIDTPGHADFSGEVERVINMADGALLIVDAAEGPLPQTQFVLEQALKNHLKLIVVINKIDRKDARPQEVLREVEELFLRLASHDDHLHFPVLYAVGREGKAWTTMPTSFEEEATLNPVFETIITHVPAPQGESNKPFKMLISTLDFDPYKGTYAIGKISQGTIKPGQSIVKLLEHESLGTFKIQDVYTSVGLERIPVEIGQTGDIVALTGLEDINIGQTIADPVDPTGFPAIKLQEPTLKVLLAPNTSPFAGREGKFHTERQIEDRLKKEQKTNIGLKIEKNTEGAGFLVSGRGELHLAVLIETLRREGFELQVSKPEVILHEIDGQIMEPYEELTIDIDATFVGVITEELGKRRGELLDTHTNDANIARMLYKISSRNLLGFRSDILTKTRGTGIFATRFIGYFPLSQHAPKIRNGVLISFDTGKATTYSLQTVHERGTALIGPGTPVYEGMIIGINARQDDIEINVSRAKKLTNNRSAGEDTIMLAPPTILSLEQSLDFIEEDELLEVTPENLRLRKKYLSKVERTRASR